MKICYTINNVVYFVVDNKEDKMKTVNDLFNGYEWNRISRGYRLLLDTLLLNNVNSSGTNLYLIEKISSKQQKYRVCNNQ